VQITSEVAGPLGRAAEAAATGKTWKPESACVLQPNLPFETPGGGAKLAGRRGVRVDFLAGSGS